MTRISERTDEALKKDSREWWSRHSQDYVAPGETPHEGVPEGMSDDDFLAYLDSIDRNFLTDAYFAQQRGRPLFSSLMPMEWLAGKRVLEVGCGLGAHTEMLCRAGAIVTTVDLSPTSVEVTRRRLALKGLTAEVQEADAESLPFADESFDAVWSWGVIHHSPDTVACAQEITRVLRPGGWVGIMLYHRHSFYNWINVIFRYGILRGRLLHMSVQELHNRYTDGKENESAPLSKYYTRREIRDDLFPRLRITRQRCFEQKHAISFFVPVRWRRRWERMIPDALYTWLWGRLGFLVFSEGYKPDGND
jgi:SAM-dependent methyltransferase